MVFGLEQYIANDYLRALAVVVIVFVVLKIFIMITQRIILKLTAKTETDLDDRLVAKTSRPITFIILLIGLRIAVEELVLSNAGIEGVVVNIIWSFVVVYVAVLIFHIIDILLFSAVKKLARGKNNFDAMKDLISLVKSVARVVLGVLALLYILSVWGVEIGPFLAGLGIAGIAIALALQPILANIFSGIAMILDKSVKVGDVIQLDDSTSGTVAEIGLRSTKVNTWDNELVIVPNSKLSDGLIHNIALPEPKTRVVIPFGVAYGSDIDKVKKVVLKTMEGIANLDKEDPGFRVRFLKMADSSLNFKAFFYVDSFEHRANAIDEANTKIYKALEKAGIGIPFPQMDVHLKKS
jgi:MscS family membrane protein